MPVLAAPDGARLHYTDEGEGMAVLCLPGLTRTGADFDALAAHLSGVRLIRPDYRGRGASQWTGAATYTVVQEAQDALALLDHLGVADAAVIGTSRGGLIALVLAATARERLRGVCFNDIGPVIERAGLERIERYVGRNPPWSTWDDAAAAMPAVMEGFTGVAPERWAAEVRRHYRETPHGLAITYDPALREAFLAAFATPPPDLWPLFDALAGLPVAVIRGANSDLLSAATLAEMVRRRPDAIAAEVRGRAHIPFLDEPSSLAAVRAFLEQCR